jgi:glutamate N-acetyltransferase/amino-acid N-acetyltransferase
VRQRQEAQEVLRGVNATDTPAPPLDVPGFAAAGVRCGIKSQGLDLALIAADEPVSAAAVFTRSTVVGAPVEWSRNAVRAGRVRAIVANSGCSNVAMGERGRRDAAAMAAAAASSLGAAPQQVLVGSTGVIGKPLPMARIRRGVRLAAEALAPGGLADAARAIMTTDTFPKWARATARVGGKRITLAGIAKGSGMIAPDVATMFSFLLCDAAATPAFLRRALRGVADRTYNRVSVDGECSTSDTVVLLASGRAGNAPLRSPASPGAAAFEAALLEVASELSRMLARDGEGATKLVDVVVRGGRSDGEADVAARRIANSLLVKTALFGRDPNWGRILQTIGAGHVTIRLPRASVRLAGVTVFRNGASAGPAARERAAKGLAAPEVAIEVDLGAGRGRARMWTCDLSTDYVRINAEYTT